MVHIFLNDPLWEAKGAILNKSLPVRAAYKGREGIQREPPSLSAASQGFVVVKLAVGRGPGRVGEVACPKVI